MPRVLAVLAALLLSVALSLSVRHTIAQQKVDDGDLDAAIQLWPDNLRFRSLRAEPTDLDLAASAPSGSAAWIAQAFEAEQRGDITAAEAALTEARRRDTTFAPLWALANFQFRQRRMTDFWPTARQAAVILEGDLTALYRLCLRASAEPSGATKILREIVPNRRKAIRQFFDVIAHDLSLAEASEAGVRLAPLANDQDTVVLQKAVDDLLSTGKGAPALAIWNALADAGKLPHEPLDPRRGGIVTNGDFVRSPSGRGFDWRIEPPPGVSCRTAAGRVLAIELTGDQSDDAVLISQCLPTAAGKRYRIDYRFRWDAPPDTASCVWRIGAQRVATLPPGVQTGSFEFTASRDLAELKLAAERTQGKTRPRGRLELHSVRASIQ